MRKYKFGDVITFQYTGSVTAMVILDSASITNPNFRTITEEGTAIWGDSEGQIMVLGLTNDNPGAYHQVGQTATTHYDDNYGPEVIE